MAGLMSLNRLPNMSIQTEMRPGVRIGQNAKTGGPSGVHKSFSEFLEAQIEDVNDTQIQADKAVASVATGRSHNLHEMMVALNKADLSLKMLTQVRNKAVEAYQELMRMSL